MELVFELILLFARAVCGVFGQGVEFKWLFSFNIIPKVIHKTLEFLLGIHEHPRSK